MLPMNTLFQLYEKWTLQHTPVMQFPLERGTQTVRVVEFPAIPRHGNNFSNGLEISD